MAQLIGLVVTHDDEFKKHIGRILRAGPIPVSVAEERAGADVSSTDVVIVDVRGDADSKPALEESESLEVLLVDHAEACRMLDDAELKFDMKAWLVLWMFKQLGRIA